MDIYQNNAKSLLVGFIYRPPSSKAIWNDNFLKQMENVLAQEKETYILGDINKDLLNTQIRDNWMEFIESLGLLQMVNEPTRVTEKSSTLIDHIYTNLPDNVACTKCWS